MNLVSPSRLSYFFVLGMMMSVNVKAAFHDPTKPINELISVKTNSIESSYDLQSILVSPGRTLALINGQLVGTGSTVQGARVLAIGKNHVVLFYAGQKQTIYLFGKRLWKAH